MIDLRGIARRLRLSVDQLRLAADLLQQGYQPAFIHRYRSDETGGLPHSALWDLKLEIDRQLRLEASREKAHGQLPKETQLDEEGQKHLEQAQSDADIETALRCFRARRQLASQERESQADQLLEKMISLSGSAPNDLTAWAASELKISAEDATKQVDQVKRLINSLMLGDTSLNQKLRRIIQNKAKISVHEIKVPTEDQADAEGKETSTDSAGNAATAVTDAAATKEDAPGEPGTSEVDATSGSDASASAEVANSEPATEEPATDEPATESSTNVAAAADESGVTPEQSVAEVTSPETVSESAPDAEGSTTATEAVESDTIGGSETAETPAEAVAGESTVVTAATADTPPPTDTEATDASPSAENAQSVESTAKPLADSGEQLSFGKRKSKEEKAKEKAAKAKKAAAQKLTPRQRRRRWLTSVLQPMKSLNCPLSKLTAYQQLMLGRGRRSQLIGTSLNYDERELVNASRDVFVNGKHPLAKWFESAAGDCLEGSLKAKIESDALSQAEESAQERLLETATDHLREQFLRRPVRGHNILLVDTIGPKDATIAVINAKGRVMTTDEIQCSAQPNVVSQNVIRLGELAHKHRVTLVAITNGPARRFLMATIKELMQQSSDSGLRWTMADRSGAEAYASGRAALRELATYNHRHRAAIWAARCLQDPLGEMLKVDLNRLRLGSYQRELPQEPLKKMVRETIADCVANRGVDTFHAGIDELTCIPGISEGQAQQIATLAANDGLSNREALKSSVTGWDERDIRQAIGFLRLFGGDQPLDATLIHPDDYRLAERLVENTELEMPANAPEGWEKPEKLEPEPAPESAPAAAPADSETPESAEAETPSESEEAPPPEPTDPAADAVGDEKPDEAQETAGEAKTEAESAPPSESNDEPETHETSAAVEAASGGEEAGAEATANDAEATNDPSSEATETEAAADSAKPGPKPEYSEDVVATKQQGPEIDVEKLARGWQVGRSKLKWVAQCLGEPHADARLANTPVPMLGGMPELKALEPDTCLWAVVVGVADFGAFVELGPDCSGLIHISRLSATYVEDPHQIVQVGDLMMVWVVSVDEKKGRVALTALSPEQRAAVAAERDASRNERGARGDRPPRGDGNNARGRGSRSQSGGGDRGDRRGGKPGGKRRDGGGRDNRGRSGGRGRGDSGRGSKPVVVTSKKPKAPISEAMKEGDEPLRSFSDLMQFYESKRTDDVPPPPKEAVQPEVAEETESSAEAEASVDVSVQEAEKPAAQVEPPQDTEDGTTEN